MLFAEAKVYDFELSEQKTQNNGPDSSSCGSTSGCCYDGEYGGW